MKFKKILILFVFISPMLLNGCNDSRELNALGITIAGGVDKTPNGYLLTYQVLNPKAIASKKATNESPVVLYAEEGNNFFEIKRRITTQSPRTIYSSHLRMVVLSEEVAKNGIKDIVDFLARSQEYRTDFYFVIAKNTSANKLLSILTPLEAIPGMEMYNSLKTSENLWAPTKSIKITELINEISSDGINPIITSAEITAGTNNSNSTESLKATNEISKIKYDGLAVFKKDKLVGYLDENEGKGYNYIMGNVKTTAGHVEYGDNTITLQAIEEKSKIKVSMLNQKPTANVTIDLTINVISVSGNFDISKVENKDIVCKLTEDRLYNLCNVSLKRAKDLGVDIFGFGEAIHRAYPQIWKYLKNNWENEFTNLPVTFTTNVKINNLGQITKPLFSEGND